MNLSEAKAIAGSLGQSRKMPGSSYGLSAFDCITGAKLAAIPGSVCASCYAMHDQMSWPNAQKSYARHLAAIVDPRWTAAMVVLLLDYHAKPYRRIDLGLRPGPKLTRLGTRMRLNPTGHHRWFDSGDLQSVEHLAKICEVARRTPKIKHWLPTQELGMVRAYLAGGGQVPGNLVVRVSSIMLDDRARRSWPLTSSVYTETPPTNAHICPAPRQERQCQKCRACWDREVAHVAYHSR